MLAIVLAIGLVYVVLLLLLTRVLLHREGYYSTILVFGLTAFLYNIAIPIEMALADNGFLDLETGISLRPSEQVQIAILGLMALPAFAWGYILSSFSPFTRMKRSARVLPSDQIPRGILALAIFCVGVIVVVYRRQIGGILSYETSTMTIYQNSVFAWLTTCGFVSVSAVGAMLLRKRGRFSAYGCWCIGIVAFWGIVTSDKNPILFAMMSAGTRFASPRWNRLTILAIILLAAILIMAAMPVFSLYRAGLAPSEILDNYYCGVSRSDPRGPMLSMIHALSSNAPLLGGSYRENLYIWIPHFIWRDRPLDLAEVFAQQTMPGWKPGDGYGFSLLAESYLNFTWLGPIIQYFIIGLLWGLVWQAVQWVIEPVSVQLWQAAYSTIGFYTLVLMHRGSSAATTSTLVQLLAPLILFTFIFDWRICRFANHRPCATWRKGSQ